MARILVVEDEDAVAADIQRRLKDLGYSPETASGENDAIAAAKEYKPDLVLMDIKLKGRSDGIALAQKLRDELGIPSVYLTAHADKATLARAKLTNPLGYLLKPFTDSELQAAIEIALQKHLSDSKLRESEAWYRAILRSTSDAVIVTDTKGVLSFLNRSAELLTGWKHSDAAGQKLDSVFRIISEDQRSAVKIPLSKIVKGKMHQRASGHVLLVSRDGRQTHIDDSAAALTDDRGNTIGIVLVFRDVTERHMIAAQLLTREKVEAIGTLADGIATDFSRLLGNISSYAASLSDSLIPGTSVHEDANRIADEVKRAVELTHRLANIAQASRPAQAGEISNVRLAEAIGDTVKLLEKTFASRHISFVTPDPSRLPMVSANAGQLIDVLMSIFLNSVEAMPNGGTISVDAKVRHVARPNPRLNPTAKGGKYAIIHVTDNGSGMSREVLDCALEPLFSTVKNGLKGLGLTMAYASVQQWGGWITLRSLPGKGTTVNLFVPAVEVPRQQKLRSKTPSHTILAVDDDDNCLEILRGYLAAEGYNVLTAKSAKGGLKYFGPRRISPDIVILDMIMPGKEEGREAFQMFARFAPRVGIVMTSGFSRDFVRSFLGQGGWAFVQKPIDREQLLTAIARAFQQMEPAGGGDAG